MTRLKRPRTKRKRCAHCKRVRLSKFIEWHPGIDEWQCSDFESCDVARPRTVKKPGPLWRAYGFGKWPPRPRS